VTVELNRAAMPTGSPADADPDAAVDAWRRRWRAASETLFPSLMAQPPAYAASLEAIGTMAEDLGRRGADLQDLVEAMSDPAGLVAACGVRVPPGIPYDLLVGVACGMRERDLIAEGVRDARRVAIDHARAVGADWAVLDGPASIDDLTGGASGIEFSTHLHMASRTELRATVDAWSHEPYRIDVIEAGVVPPRSMSFTRREPWIEEFGRCKSEIGERS
jgi:hypothetical protein